MATIALYANKINQMPSLITGVKKSVSDYKSELSSLKTKTLKINSSVCNLDDVISSIQSSSQTQDQKITSLENFQKNSEQFIIDVVRTDSNVSDAVTKRKNDFYKEYSYLKPECEKGKWKKFTDDCKKVGQWCKDNWKSIGKIILAVVAVVALGIATALTGGVLGVILAGAFWGALSGALIGGIIGGVTSMMSGGSFLEGFANGALSGAVTGAITGAAFAGIGSLGQVFGKALGASCKLAGSADKILKVLKYTSKITGVLALGMGGFDLLAMGVGMFDPSNPLVVFNQKLHSNNIYNAFQISVSALAIFSGGAHQGMAESMQTSPVCFIAGTMILTATGLVMIENIKAGDKVISTNEYTFETLEKQVLETYRHETSELIHVQVNGEELITTHTHPFYVPERGWVEAENLIAGDKLQLINGKNIFVEDIKIELAEKNVTVYNFQVEDFHTYHVGNIGVLVHNRCVKPKSDGTQNPDGTTTYTKKIDGKDVSVTYNGEHADFSPYAETLPNGQKSVNIKYSGSRSKDYRLADKAAGYTSKNPRPTGYTWNHIEDMSTMELINSKIHNVNQGGFPHAGGVSVYEKLTGIKYKK